MPADIDTLLAHVCFLRALSRSLVADEGIADDLVQDTWAAALASPPARPAEAKAWLARVLRNAAASFFRGEARRQTRERAVARREHLPSAAEIAERESVARRIVDAVFMLEEPYRTTILLRFYEDMKPASIAQRQGGPVETVRTRLRRGLERMRVQLQRSLGTGKETRCWVSAVMIVAEPACSSAHATSSAAAPPAAASLPHFFSFASVGGALMSTKLTIISFVVAVALAASSGFLWTEWQDSEDAAAALHRDRDGLADELAGMRDRLAVLKASLSDAQATLQDKDAELARARSLSVTIPVLDADETTDQAPADSMISSVDEADSVVADFVARGDVEGLFGVLSELLFMGEEGYDKIVEIAAQFDDEKIFERFMSLWTQHDGFLMVNGALARDLARNAEGILHFARYLEGRDPSQLPSIVREIHGEIDDHIGLMVFGMYDGQDKELLDTFSARCQRRVAEDKKVRAETIMILGLIGTNAARDILLEYAETAPTDRMFDVARSLARIGDPQALPVLRDLRQRATDVRDIDGIDAAIRLLE